MFFSGDASTKKRVDLGGRSSKERDRSKLLEQTRLERNRRLGIRQQNAAALKIQKCFRGRTAVKAEHSRRREQFFATYGKQLQNVDRNHFRLDSDFLPQLLFFFDARKIGDFSALVEACRILQRYAHDTGDIVSIFAGVNYLDKHALVNYRVKQLIYYSILAVHQNRNQLKDQLLSTSEQSSLLEVVLVEAVIMLIDTKLPWTCNIVSYLFQRNVYCLLRDIVLAAKDVATSGSIGRVSSLERLFVLLISHVGERPCTCTSIDPRWSFPSQILTVPFLWHLFPYLKEVFATYGHGQHYIHQIGPYRQSYAKVLPCDVSPEFPSHGCLLGNLLEFASVALSQPGCSYELAKDLAAVLANMLEALPSMIPVNRETSTMAVDDMDVGDEISENVLNNDLKKQILNATDLRFLLQLINVLFEGFSLANDSHGELDNREVAAVGAACAFLHVTFNTLPYEHIMTVLAYRTELVPVLWNFIKKCHENQKWSAFSEHLSYLSGDLPGWLLPLAVFCPVYKHILTIVDNEEFYEKENPLPLNDVRILVIILKKALWNLLWSNPVSVTAFTHERNPVEFLHYRVSVVASELLSQLQDWNNRREFTTPSDFHANGVNEHFISQAMMQNSRANDILKQAPFLVPFTSRVKIFASQLEAAKKNLREHSSRSRIKIRRDHILEDAYDQMSAFSEDELRGVIRIMFVNEFGAEEAGVDGGGIFKDFMENVTKAAFDVQYGLFKETVDRMLYPNPGSGMIHEQHLQFFHFVGTVLAKGMFEGILVDIPFATFFLSKLKQKVNYLNDLPSLDPELHRHLIFLKHYKGDISDLELYFVIVKNEYGEQMEEELLPGGKNIRVTNENVITFIHLMATHRLNIQIRQQSSHFSRGFQQLIQKDWIDMFNEHELQLLISGSLDGLDVDDLRSNTNYTGGYHPEHYVIETFWEVLKSFSMQNQMKFLKFVTGCSRGPLLGFRYLEPKFCIQRVGGTSNETVDRLPTAATCMNLLKLPPYQSKQQLEAKLLYAISANAGFDLS